MRTSLKSIVLTVGPRTLSFCVAALALVGGASTVVAQPGNPYPTIGTENPVSYSFKATTTGDIIAYFAGTGASYTEDLGMEVNGVLTSAGFGLVNQTSAVGQSFDLGHANAGDTLTFVVDVTSPNLGDIYSNPALNVGYDNAGETIGHNHVYSMPYTAGSISEFGDVPSGTYVGFEDLPFPNSDFNYFDETYVFQDVSVTSTVPDSASSIALLGVGFAGLSVLRRRQCA
jgi:hypothetical protein